MVGGLGGFRGEAKAEVRAKVMRGFRFRCMCGFRFMFTVCTSGLVLGLCLRLGFGFGKTF